MADDLAPFFAFTATAEVTKAAEPTLPALFVFTAAAEVTHPDEEPPA